MPGAAENAASATNFSGGTRWVSALTVTTRTRGRSSAPRLRASRASAVMRCDEIAAIGRNAVVGLAIPRGKEQRLDLGRGEAERVDEALGARAVAGDEDQRRGAGLAGAREAPRQRGDDESVETFGRAAERDGAAGGEALDGRSERFHVVSASLSDAAGARRRRAKQRRVEGRRDRRFAGDPRQQFGIGRVEQALEFVEFGLAHRRQIRRRRNGP